MKHKLLTLFGLLLTGLFLFSLSLPAAASPQAQAVYFTPTPRPDGRIIYVVKQGDTCISVSLLNRISEATLRQLNNIRGSDCIIQLGAELLLGMAGPVESPTVGPSPTATALLPTPTPFAGTGEVCVVLFEDINGNGISEDGEGAMIGGQVSLTDRQGKFSRTGTTFKPATADDKPLCFDKVPEGDYNVSLAVPEGYNPTTNTNFPLKVKAGDAAMLDFGSQISLRTAPPAAAGESSQSPLLGILGGGMVLAGAGLALYLRRSTRK